MSVSKEKQKAEPRDKPRRLQRTGASQNKSVTAAKARQIKGNAGSSSKATGQTDPQPPLHQALLAPARRLLGWGLTAREFRGKPLAFAPIPLLP